MSQFLESTNLNLKMYTKLGRITQMTLFSFCLSGLPTGSDVC